jgi:hypothetical protein
MAVMQEPIKHRTHCGDIAEQLAPVFDRTIGSKQSAETFVAAHEEMQKVRADLWQRRACAPGFGTIAFQKARQFEILVSPGGFQFSF